jgi:putative PIN family toxin of toxin-antitoxin system
MTARLIVLDTNVLVAGLRSNRGISFQLLNMIGTSAFDVAISVPLVMEYEAVLVRPGMIPIPHESIGAILDYICAVGRRQNVFYLWRPRLRDPADDMILELALNAGADAIVTHNIRDFAGAEQMGVAVLKPAGWLSRLD